jgi:glucose/mannose-6-phosphate isomerase
LTGFDLDDPKAVAQADPSGMLQAVLALPLHLREGYRAGRAVQELPDGASVSSIAMCGMGGSGVAADIVRAIYRDRLPMPLEVNKDPELPEFCGRETLVVCSSFSGNTAETLACFDEASARGCHVVALASGGALVDRARELGVPVVQIPPDAPAPRAALGLLLGATLGVLESMGLIPAVGTDLEEAGAVLETIAGEVGPEIPVRDNPAKTLAQWIGDRIPVVWGAEGLGSVAAVRWKTELNENAKTPAWASSLPELDHNEVVGWSKGAGERFVVLALRHPGERPEVAARFAPSLELIAESGGESHEISARGLSALARILSLTMMGSATSVYFGLLRGFDPMPIEAIDRLKRALEDTGE